MQEFINKKNLFSKNHCQSPVRKFYDILESVKEQIEIESFSPNEKMQAEEICLIISEVFQLNPNAEIKIGGTVFPVEMVQEIYSRLNSSHIEMVLMNFNRATYEIKHKKTYLRTALYNAVFENESFWQNQVQKDMYGKTMV